MLSAFKNFLITFLIGALLFGTIGFLMTDYVSGIITGLLDGEKDKTTNIINAPTESETEEEEPEEDGDLIIPDGNSFTFVVVGTDYRPDIYDNYYHTVKEFQSIVKEESETTSKSSKKDSDKKESSKKTEKDTEKSDKKNDKKDETETTSKNNKVPNILNTDVRYIEATWIALVRADKESREYVLCYISPETRVSAPVGEATLGEVYGLYGADVFIEYINMLTGLEIDYRFIMDGRRAEELVSTLGAASFNLSSDIYSFEDIFVSDETSVVTLDATTTADKDPDEETEKSDKEEKETETSATEETEDPKEEPGETDEENEDEEETETYETETVENEKVLEEGSHTLNSNNIHVINTFKEGSTSDINEKSSIILSFVKQYITRLAAMSENEMSTMMDTLTKHAKDYKIEDPYSKKPILATEFTTDEVVDVHSMLGAIEYFEVTEMIYPGTYSDRKDVFVPDIKAAHELFSKYKATTTDEEEATEVTETSTTSSETTAK